MPHKHKRKRGDEGDYELPPTRTARPLAVGSQGPKDFKNSKGGKGKGGKGSKGSKEQAKPQELKPTKRSKRADNDTPRAFRRIMAVASGKKFRKALDDGNDSKPTKTEAADTEAPRIKPGEDLRSFSARVDAALPVSGLTKKTIVKDGKDEQGNKVWRTRKELKMHKLYDQWRAEDRKAKERREEELELEAERELENDAENITSSTAARFMGDAGQGGKKKKRRGKDDDDPWAALKKKRAEAKVGLHDVAQAPPELNKKTTRQLSVKNGAGVDVDGIPKSAGSLKRREELQKERNDILEAYRKVREYEQAKLNAAGRTEN